MKRSNFIAIISAIFLAPFGIKAKSEYTILRPDPSLFGMQEFSCRVTLVPGTKAPETLFACPDLSIAFPPIPDDGVEHDIVVIRHGDHMQYFIDGKEVSI
jgi:hypothetical protein